MSASSGSVAVSRQLRQFMGTEFEDFEEIGWGFSGIVFKSQHRSTQQLFARKIIHDNTRSSGAENREFLIYQRLTKIMDEGHSTILKCFGSLPKGFNGHIHGGLIFEYMSLGSLADQLRKHPAQGLPESVILAVAWSTLNAAAILEAEGIIHRDIKPGNILFNHEGRVKLADFGEAVLVEEGQAVLLSSEDYDVSSGGSVAYMAPERLAGGLGRFSSKSDVWSIGVCLLEMAMGRYPFNNELSSCSMIELWESIVEGAESEFPQIPAEMYSAQLAQLISACLLKDPSQRPTATQTLFKYAALFQSQQASCDELVNYLQN